MEVGKFIKKNNSQQYTLGVVYEPDTKDAHDEYSTADEIEKTAWEYMKNLQSNKLTKSVLDTFESIIKSIDEDTTTTVDVTDIYEEIKKSALNDMHINTDSDHQLGTVVECYIAPCDMTVGDETIKKGSWMMGTIWNEEYFQKIVSGERNGYSMEGKGKKVSE